MIDYDPHDWFSHLLDIRGSMVREIIGRVSLCVAWATAVTAIDYAVPGDALNLPTTVHQIVGTALGLLLVFRTNASYDRFWEGRKLWGSIINETRNLARAATVHLAGQPKLLRRVLLWTVSLPASSMHWLRGNRALNQPARALPAGEVSQVLSADHPPTACAARITTALVEARNQGIVGEYLFVEIDRNVQLLIDYIGACERIRSTPLPFAYVVHLRRALLLYCYSLPFVLLHQMGWWTIPATFLVAYFFFGIEEIGVEIEDPFGVDDNDLPLDRFVEMLERNLFDLAGMDLDVAPFDHPDSAGDE